jgi:acylphosphatase
MSKKRIHIFYSGRVQGVGFRFTAERFALDLGLVGWVMNLPDGRVEIECDGEETKIKKFLEKIKEAFNSYIKNSEVQWMEATGEFKDFEIRFY